MTLVVATTAVGKLDVGTLEYTVATVASLAGVQEIEPGWLLCNGAAITSGGFTASGYPMAALYAFLGTLYGVAGTLPSLLDGVRPAARGGTNYPTINATDGVATVTLGLSDITGHVHTWSYEGSTNPLANGWQNMGSTPPYDDGGYDTTSNSGANGSGGAHNNMPPYLVVEGMLIKL